MRQGPIWQVPKVCQDLPIAGNSANAISAPFGSRPSWGKRETFCISFNIRIDAPNIKGTIHVMIERQGAD
jgi:hypothetical protein